MPAFEPCPSCHRHVRTDETTCPFCSAAVREHFAALEPRTSPTKRLGRAALFAFGVTAATASLTSCGDDDSDDAKQGSDDGKDGDEGSDGAKDDAGTQMDGGGAIALYGAGPIPDAGPSDDDLGGGGADYGSPPDEGSDASDAVLPGEDAGVDGVGTDDSGNDGAVQPLYGAAPSDS